MPSVNILFIGDIIGNPGLQITQTFLPGLIQKYKADVVICNGENVSDGKGCTEKEAKILFDLGVSVITGGNHTWDKHTSQDYLKVEPRYLRPLNYPKGTHGNGHIVLDSPKGKVAVVNLQGRTFMSAIDCPFRTAEWIISKVKNETKIIFIDFHAEATAEWIISKVKNETKIIFIDFHAEATAEKMALANFLDGKVSCIVGTHTHIQTSDERILTNGTGYITDVGMTGPYDSVIGMKSVAAINRFLYQTPQKYETAKDNVHLCGIFFKVDSETGKTVELERIFFPEFDKIRNSSNAETSSAKT